MPKGVSVRSVPRAQAETGSVVTDSRKLRNAANILFFMWIPPLFLLYLFYPVLFLAVYYGTHYTDGYEQTRNPQQVIAVIVGFGGGQRYALQIGDRVLNGFCHGVHIRLLCDVLPADNRIDSRFYA